MAHTSYCTPAEDRVRIETWSINWAVGKAKQDQKHAGNGREAPSPIPWVLFKDLISPVDFEM
jgi:hypothetical protein